MAKIRAEQLEAVAAVIQSVVVDVGRTPLNEKTFTVTDAAVTPTSRLMLARGNFAETDENSDEQFGLSWRVGTGQFNVTLFGIGTYPLLQGQFRLNYLVG